MTPTAKQYFRLLKRTANQIDSFVKIRVYIEEWEMEDLLQTRLGVSCSIFPWSYLVGLTAEGTGVLWGEYGFGRRTLPKPKPFGEKTPIIFASDSR